MAAPKKNQFWRQRSKHGRDKIFSSPEILFEAATEYFDWCDAHPWYKQDFVGSGPKAGTKVELKTYRPYTLSGLCIFLDIDEDTFNNYGSKKKYKDFFGVVSRVRQIIWTQKFEGAAVGAFNPSIIARDLGMVDKKDIDHKTNGKDITTPPPIVFMSTENMSEEQIEKYLNRNAGANNESI